MSWCIVLWNDGTKLPCGVIGGFQTKAAAERRLDAIDKHFDSTGTFGDDYVPSGVVVRQYPAKMSFETMGSEFG